MAIKKSSGSGIPSGNTAGRPANPGLGQLYSNGEAARLELYTQASGWQNIIQETPGVSSITGNYLESTNSGTITIYGTNFVSGAYATAIGTNGVQVDAVSTTYNSLVQLTATFTGLVGANEPYDIKVTNPSNLFGILPDGLFVNNNPTWTTPAGSLGSFAEQISATIYALSISDDSTMSYSLASGSSLPAGVTLSSAGIISGTLPDVASNTTYTFTVNATDGLNPTISRTFSFISNAAPIWSTESGSLGAFNKNTSISVLVSATDVSDSVSYNLASGSLPQGVTLNSSTGVISGTLPNISTETVYTFIINASDGINNVPRTFSITVRPLVAIEYLVVAGGGGGGGITVGGGGGAGGMLTGAQNLSASSLITLSLSIGQGGTGVLTNGTDATNGSNSTLSFSGSSSYTAIGGGAGGNYNGGVQPAASRGTGNSGGSGGGGGDTNKSGGAPTSGQGFGGGTSGPTWNGAGGGGAGAAGGNGVSGLGGAGGNGLQSSITGTSTYYAGGGGGCSDSQGGSAGLGGGGLGGGNSPARNSSAGAANTGGGGGGTRDNPSGGPGSNGGSGVVIIAYPEAMSAPTIPGSLTYDTPTRAGYKVYRFTAGSGTITV